MIRFFFGIAVCCVFRLMLVSSTVVQEHQPSWYVAFVAGSEAFDADEFNWLEYVGEDAYRFWSRLESLTKLDHERSVLRISFP